jgi:hypothetical protein
MPEVAEGLLALLGDERDAALEQISSPAWDSRRFRWPYYVRDEIADLWESLPLEARIIAYLTAVETAEKDDPP